MLVAGLHAHEASQVAAGKLKWKNAHTSEAFKINVFVHQGGRTVATTG